MSNVCRLRSKLLVFDLDGTLVNTGGAGKRAIDDMFLKFYSVTSAMEGVDPRGKTDPRIFAEIFQKKLGRSAKKGEIKRLVGVFPRFLKPQVSRSPGYRLVDGIKKFLDVLGKIQGVYLALGTGNIEKGARVKLARGGLNRFFPVGGFATDSVKRPELLRQGVAKACRRYKQRFRKQDVFVIGDTVRDVCAARQCGFKSVVVAAPTVDKREVLAAKPDFYFKDYSRPEDWIEKLELRAKTSDHRHQTSDLRE